MPDIQSIPRTFLKAPPADKEQQHKLIEEVSGKDLTFSNFDFSYSIFRGSYFNGCAFDRCKFVGCHFESTSLRSAQFRHCDFRYATFDKTVLPIKELLANQPEWPNVRRELMQRLRANAISVGDYEAEKICIHEELRAEREHLRRAREKRESYYANKYSSVAACAKVWWQSLVFYLMNTLWGHGEHLWRAFMFILIFILLCPAIVVLAQSSDLLSNSLYASADRYWRFLGASLDAFLDIDYSIAKAEFPFLLRLIVLVRYVTVGLLLAALYRRLAKR